MIYTVSTLQELLEAVASASTNDLIQLTSDISIAEVTEFASETFLHIDLNSNRITISAENGINITDGGFEFTGGVILCTEDGAIHLEGDDTAVVLGSNLTVSGQGNIITVNKKARLEISGADIANVGSSGEGAVISVEGYTNANTNSRVEMHSGAIAANGNYDAVRLTKKGSITVDGGTIVSDSAAISKGDDSATSAVVTGGRFKGAIPEGSVDETNYAITEPDANGYYEVVAIDLDSEADSDSEIDSEPTLNSDSDSEAESDSEIGPFSIPEQDSASDVDLGSQPATDQVSESDGSYALTKVTCVFAIPSIKFPIDNIIGSIKILEGSFVDPETDIEFIRIEYTLPGNGRKAVGYVFASTVAGE